jgi:phospholipase C
MLEHAPPPGERSASITRRALLAGAAGGAAMVAVGRLPAWGRPAAASVAGIRPPNSLPFPHLPEGTPTMPKIEHIVVLMMENHSFDNLLGMLPHQVSDRRDVDGWTVRHRKVQNFNRGPGGHKVFASHARSPCQLIGEPSQTWNASHESYDNGRLNGFVRASGDITMSYWDGRDIPFTYSLARHFPVGNRYFCSVLAQTYPNRRYLFTGTSSGLVATDATAFTTPAANGTIFDRLDRHGIDWGIYFQQLPSYVIIPGAATPERVATRQHLYPQFLADAAAGRLPAFTFLDPNYSTTSEENPQDIQVGEQFLTQVVQALVNSSTWSSTALFITYDEHGGYYDHVPPPRAIKPDSIPPTRPPDSPPLAPGGFDRYGFRVPLIVVSPWAKRRYVSHVVQDHTSITAFVERKWNLPAMTFRDANAHPMTDYFHFRKAAFLNPPRLAGAPALASGLARCRAAGLNPPLPS